MRLKGGDPYIFGRGGEEAEELAAAKIPFEIVPGVSSVVAPPNYAGIPLTHRGFCSSFTVITGELPLSGRPPLTGTLLRRALPQAKCDATNVIVFMKCSTKPSGISERGSLNSCAMSRRSSGGADLLL